METLLKNIEKYILYATLFFVPVAFANISPNPYIVVKLVILVSGVSLALIVWCLRILVGGKLEFHKGRFDFPVLIIVAAYLISAILKTPNKMEAILLPGTATAIVASAVLYFLINQYEEKRGFVLSILSSGALFSFVTLLSAFKALESIPQLPQFVKAAGFTPEGGYLPAALFLFTLLMVGIGTTVFDKSVQGKVIGGIASGIIALGVIASIINIVPGSKFAPRFPNIATSWSVAIDTVKDSPLLGVGPGNYLTAFSRFRPISYNQSDLWAVKFGTATNFYVTVLTEVGLLGIAGILLIVFVLYRQLRKAHFGQEGSFAVSSIDVVYSITLIILLILLALFPATLLITFLLFVLLSFASFSRKTVLNLETQGSENDSSTKGTKIPALLLTVPILAVVGYVLYKGVGIVKAEHTFTQAIAALNQSDAQKTYQHLNDAIKQNPSVDRYRMTTAQVSLLLANSIAQKKDVSDSDRQTISTLVQLAIEQAKAGVALNPQRSTNWEVLAGVYKAIMPLAKGADQFAVQAASQAVVLDPYNPNLRIALGGIYYAMRDFDNAVKIFETAVAAKNDHINAYYNLAFAYREKGDYEKAVQAMSRVVSLVDKNSPDYELARKALEDMEAKRKENTEDKKGEELTTPKEDTPVLDPKLNLPEGSEPPEGSDEKADTDEAKVSVSPTVPATVSPSLSPTATPNQ
jgi:tetratricopeptide (TPR) repeat protein